MTVQTRAAAPVITATSAAALGIGIASAIPAADPCSNTLGSFLVNGKCVCTPGTSAQPFWDGFACAPDANYVPPPAPMPSPLPAPMPSPQPKPNRIDQIDAPVYVMPGNDNFVDKCHQDPQSCGFGTVPNN